MSLLRDCRVTRRSQRGVGWGADVDAPGIEHGSPRRFLANRLAEGEIIDLNNLL